MDAREPWSSFKVFAEYLESYGILAALHSPILEETLASPLPFFSFNRSFDREYTLVNYLRAKVETATKSIVFVSLRAE